MPTLYLLRHAKSDWSSPGIADHDRPLAERGRRAGALMVEHLRHRDASVGQVLCSTALRTRQTLAIVLDAFDPTPDVTYDPLLYGATGSDILSRVREVDSAVGGVLLVGHNPGVADLASALAGRGDPHEMSEMASKYPTCGLAVLSWQGTWSSLEAGGAELMAFVTPRLLGAS